MHPTFATALHIGNQQIYEMVAKIFLSFLFGCSVASATISANVDDVKFYYYQTAGQHVEISISNNLASSSISAVRSQQPTIILIDGFLSNLTSPMSQILKTSEVTRGGSQLNVIVVDWGRLSGNGMTLSNSLQVGLAYSKVLNNVGPVGSRVADFIHLLSTTRNILPSNVHVVAHSLGSHIAGAAGTFHHQRYGQLIGRISGLDPAGPFFNLQVDSDKRLDKTDATFVDIIHTNRGTLGDSAHQTGDINVYVNGGDNQPGCEEADSAGFKGYCSHSYSWKVYDASIHRDLLACPCSGYACQCKSNCNTQCSNPIPVGARAPRSASGAYHLTLSDSLVQYAV